MLKDTCGVEWCDEPVRRVGLCHTHSMYQRRHQFGVTHFISPTQAECLWVRACARVRRAARAVTR